MKNRLLLFGAIILFLLAGCKHEAPAATTAPTLSEVSVNRECVDHVDVNADGNCDNCAVTVEVVFDFFGINDLHGKIADADTHPGVDELTTYIKNAQGREDNVVVLSVGDMWQGSAESNLTKGLLTTDWMNDIGFAAMTLGNHEFDWGEEYIELNAELAEFPFLAINVYDRDTNKQVEYCQSSVIVDQSGIQIGIIGAIGDCYSSIASEKSEGVYFITGDMLTDMVMAESVKLRQQGVDFVVYVIHDGYTDSSSATAKSVNGTSLQSYYDTDLSAGYVDLVFEGHTHQRYLLRDEYGVYHIQNKGDNKGITHVEVIFNTANDTAVVSKAELLATGTYALMEDDPIVEELLDKYSEDLEIAYDIPGFNSRRRDRDALRQLVADLYYRVGMETWSEEYDIVLGGGFLSVRSPGYLAEGEVSYSMLQSLFPFDNQLTLCSVRGTELISKFFESSNSNYFISYGDYGSKVRKNIDPNETYYVVVDTYSAYYAPNRLTVVEEYDENIFARDLLAEFIRAGGLE